MVTEEELKKRNEAFLKRLREMSNVDLAARLEAGGVFIAPNPHYVLEAARRLRCIEDRIRNAVAEFAEKYEQKVEGK
jgi:hypothetical protein